MTRSFTEINSTIAGQLAESIGRDRFDMWFGAGQPIQIVDGKLVVQAADDLSLSFIRQQFGATIQEVARETAGADIAIRYTLTGDTANTVRQASLFSDNQLAEAGIDQPAGDSTGKDLKRPVPPGKPARESNRLRPTRRPKTLASFRFGGENKLLETAVDQMLSHPGRFNPLVLHGPIGSGKTHLLQAVVGQARQGEGYRRCVCITSEQFTTGFIEGLQGKGLPLFRSRYRQLDLLAIDDIQFLAGKKATLVEFQNTMESLLRSGKQIVISSDRPVFELEFLGESLVTRLSSGMNCPIAWPDGDARFEIAINWVRDNGLNVDAEVSRMVCDKVARDVRMLQGALNRVHAASLAMQQAVDPATASELLSDLFLSQSPVISLDQIERVVCDVCGVLPDELKSQKRIKRVSNARMLAIWLSRRHTSAGLAEIGAYYGGRNHSTVVAARKKIDAMSQSQEEIDIKSGRIKVAAALSRLEDRLQVG